MRRQLIRNAFDNQAVAQLENQARQILNMPQAATIVGPTGQASRIDQAIRQQRAARQAGEELRYDKVKVIEPEFEYQETIYSEPDPFDPLQMFDIPVATGVETRVMPEREVTRNQERQEILKALKEPNEAQLRQEQENIRQNRSRRKAGMDVKPEDMKGLSDKDLKTIGAAKEVISKHMGILGATGLGATGAGVLANGFAVDGDGQDNIQDAAVASGLLGLGGYSGYHAGQMSYEPMTERMVDRQIARKQEPKLYGSAIGRDMRNQAARGRTGAAIGAGAGALLGLIKAYEQDEQQLYR